GALNINVDNIAVGKPDNVVVLTGADNKPLALVSGDAVTADVIDVIASGLVMLRIAPPLGKSDGGGTLLARTDIPLSQGDRISLQVQSAAAQPGSNAGVTLKIIGKLPAADQPPSPPPDVQSPPLPSPDVAGNAVNIQQKTQALLTELAGSRLTSTDLQNLRQVLNLLPPSVKDGYPQFKQLSQPPPDIENLTVGNLKAAVENSGIFFETNVRQIAIAALNNTPEVLTARDALSAIVQKAAEAFQYPQTEAHTRSFLTDLISVVSNGAKSLNSDNVGQTMTMLKQAIDDCIAIVKQDTSEHKGCNCGDLLTNIKQTLDTAMSPQALPKEGIIAVLKDNGAPQPQDLTGRAQPTQVPESLLSPQTQDIIAVLTGDGKVMQEGATGRALPQDLTGRVLPQDSTGIAQSTLKPGPESLITAKTEELIAVLTGDVKAQPQDDSQNAVRQKTNDMVNPQTSPKDSVQTTPHPAAKEEHTKAVININNDPKALLLKVRELLQDDKTSESMKYSGAKHDELALTVDKFIKNIEFFQLTSKANDMIYTYLPLQWNGLKDGELLFKKNKYHAQKSFTCDINLDLDKLGKLSVSVTKADSGFFISFNAEKDSTKQLILENKGELEQRFAAAGLSLKIVNVGQKAQPAAAPAPSGGLDLRI
ncbi:MAG: flagellar hook-length control protein FliK, partial [Candidatus Magnetominusculus sp. LBB02]|nr:flagellar hook-length control protein FliK [Candidatus Magnetominusculus sp. LBB02]